MIEIKAIPNSSFSAVNIEVSTPAECNVIMWVRKPDGRLLRVFGWKLRQGLNITALNNLGSIDAGTYTVGITDTAYKVYATQFVKSTENTV